MIRWMCGVKLQDKLYRVELKQRSGMEDSKTGTKKQTAMEWTCFKKRWRLGEKMYSITLEVEAAIQTGRPRKTWKEVVDK